MVRYRKTCRSCFEHFIFEVDPVEFNRWRRGTVIQEAMPNLSADERLLLISGICGKCFNALRTRMEE